MIEKTSYRYMDLSTEDVASRYNRKAVGNQPLPSYNHTLFANPCPKYLSLPFDKNRVDLHIFLYLCQQHMIAHNVEVVL